jgi:hypothetical protein
MYALDRLNLDKRTYPDSLSALASGLSLTGVNESRNNPSEMPVITKMHEIGRSDKGN